MLDEHSGNTTEIEYQETGTGYRSAVIRYRHKRSDYVGILRVVYWPGGPDAGFRFEDLTPVGDAYIPSHAIIEVMESLGKG